MLYLRLDRSCILQSLPPMHKIPGLTQAFAVIHNLGNDAIVQRRD